MLILIFSITRYINVVATRYAVVLVPSRSNVNYSIFATGNVARKKRKKETGKMKTVMMVRGNADW